MDRGSQVAADPDNYEVSTGNLSLSDQSAGKPIVVYGVPLDSDTLIRPRETGRKLFTIATGDSVRLYADFDEFVEALTIARDGTTAARSM